MSSSVDDVIIHKYDKFEHPHNRMPYAFLEVPIAFLDEELPEEANWSAKEDGQKTVGEYCLSIIKSLDETKAVIRLTASIEERFRKIRFSIDDLQDWETWLNTKSYTINNFLTISERNTLLKTSDYSTDEE